MARGQPDETGQQTNEIGPLAALGAPPPKRSVVALKLLAILGLLWIFILSITLLGDGFKLLGSDLTAAVFRATSNPMVGLMIGVLSTSIVQSSSTTTSLIVGLVATGAIPFNAAVPMVMGANIGTSITNILVSLGHISHREEFRRAFAASILHDFFNVCSVAVLLPMQLGFGLIGRSAHFLERIFAGFGGIRISSPLAEVTKPVAKLIIHATGDSAVLTLVIAVLLLFIALRYIVVVLKSMVLGTVEKFFRVYVFRTPVLGLLLGIGLTVLVQSSSITTSMVVPLIGAGVVTSSQIYPYLLGANLGTTITAFLASFVTGSDEAVAVAFAHFLFNAYGIAIFWPLSAVPMFLAETLSRWTQRSRLVPLVYIAVVFFIVPAAVIFLTR